MDNQLAPPRSKDLDQLFMQGTSLLTTRGKMEPSKNRHMARDVLRKPYTMGHWERRPPPLGTRLRRRFVALVQATALVHKIPPMQTLAEGL